MEIQIKHNYKMMNFIVQFDNKSIEIYNAVPPEIRVWFNIECSEKNVQYGSPALIMLRVSWGPPP